MLMIHTRMGSLHACNGPARVEFKHPHDGTMSFLLDVAYNSMHEPIACLGHPALPPFPRREETLRWVDPRASHPHTHTASPLPSRIRSIGLRLHSPLSEEEGFPGGRRGGFHSCTFGRQARVDRGNAFLGRQARHTCHQVVVGMDGGDALVVDPRHRRWNRSTPGSMDAQSKAPTKSTWKEQRTHAEDVGSVVPT